MKSPTRSFFLAGLLCLILGAVLGASGQALVPRLIGAVGPQPEFSSEALALPRYYFETGQPDKAVDELRALLGSDPLPPIETAAKTDLQRIISLQSNIWGQLAFWVRNLSSFLPAKLIIASLFLWLIALIFYFIRALGPHPLFVVMPFVDRADVGFGENLSTMILSRMREISWQRTNLPNNQKLISENLDIPSIGLVDEGDSLDTIALLETALLFSTGINDFPLVRLINSIRLWAEQPKYLIRGCFEKTDNQVCINFQLLDRKKGRIEKVWNCTMDFHQSRRSELIDNILFPLLFHFSKEVGTNKWEALLASHAGLEAFQSYLQYQEHASNLNSARNYLEQAIRLDPAYRLAYYNLGVVHLAAGEYEKACERFLNAMRLAQGELP